MESGFADRPMPARTWVTIKEVASLKQQEYYARPVP